MQAAEERPPYVRYETRSVEDRDASITAGHYVGKDVDFALITPQGSKDVVERVVSEWFDNLASQVQQQRFKREWLEGYREHYSAWKKGEEIPESGSAIKLWPAVSPSQIKAILNARVRTVEDLAAANEQTLAQIGMGARALKQRAIEWLASATDTGKQAEAMAALKTENEGLKTKIASQDERLAALEKALEAIPPKK